MAKRFLIVILVLIVMSISGCATTFNASDPPASDNGNAISYDTPEKAVQAFLNAVIKNDYDAAMNTCPAEKMANNFDFKTAYERAQSTNYSALLGPSEYDFYKETNADIVRGQFATHLWLFVTSFASSSDLNELVSQCDPKQWSGVQILRIDAPYQVDSEQSIENYKKVASGYGADGMTERIALIKHESETWMAGFTLVRYSGSWYIHAFYSGFAGTPTIGRLTLSSENDYIKIVEGK